MDINSYTGFRSPGTRFDEKYFSSPVNTFRATIKQTVASSRPKQSENKARNELNLLPNAAICSNVILDGPPCVVFVTYKSPRRIVFSISCLQSQSSDYYKSNSQQTLTMLSSPKVALSK